MIQISISEEVAKACPDLHILALSCDVTNTESDVLLWEEITALEHTLRENCKLEDINQLLPIKATRQAYKKLGKDPNRYRPSAEALYRRILRGLPLYKIDTLVDIINLISVRSAYSIGAFDMDKVKGDRLVLGVGQEGESYHAIGRGELNIAGLPVYRDEQGGIGTPTSDEERTKIELQTTRLLMIVNGYSGLDGLEETGHYAWELLKRYASAINPEYRMIAPLNVKR
jgi:DNA/RNA-binding domain of Phe-tRNA-synthetase-like protein